MTKLTFLAARTLLRKILVSAPVNSTSPMTHSVFRRVHPLQASERIECTHSVDRQ